MDHIDWPQVLHLAIWVLTVINTILVNQNRKSLGKVKADIRTMNEPTDTEY